MAQVYREIFLKALLLKRYNKRLTMPSSFMIGLERAMKKRWPLWKSLSQLRKHIIPKSSCLQTATISNDYPQGFIRNDSIAVRIAKEKRFRAISASRPWMLYWGAEPTRETLLTLYAPDTAHPGPRGGYLYALMIYTTLTGDTPIGLTYDIPGMKLSSEEAAALQNAAWKAHQSFVEDTK
jgi:hypothetical protein